ncbi:hypothetical protein V2J09_015783 [Rumex salicifolius]
MEFNPFSLALILSFLTLILISKVDPSSSTATSTKPKSEEEESSRPNPQITVMGMVYCDFCSNNTFSRHSYFLPGVEVKVDCKFKAAEPRTAEEIAFTVNRTTNRHGIYRLEIPAVDGIECAAEPALVSATCQASLLSSSSPKCNVPGYRATSDVISIKARQPNLCIYSLNAMTFHPSRKNKVLCGGN